MKDIDKKFNFHSDMIEGNSNIKGRNSTKSKIKKWNIVMKLHSDIINKEFDEKVQEVDIVEEVLEEILILV